AGVIVDTDYSILAAGGLIIQLMPGATDEVTSEIEKRIELFPQISSLIKQGKTPEEILRWIFREEELQILETMPLSFHCRCSKERMLTAVKGLGEKEIQSMIDDDHGAEATCHFCNEVYYVTEEELQQLLID